MFPQYKDSVLNEIFVHLPSVNYIHVTMNLIDPERPPILYIEAAVRNGGWELYTSNFLGTKMKLDEQDFLGGRGGGGGGGGTRPPLGSWLPPPP